MSHDAVVRQFSSVLKSIIRFVSYKFSRRVSKEGRMYRCSRTLLREAYENYLRYCKFLPVFLFPSFLLIRCEIVSPVRSDCVHCCRCCCCHCCYKSSGFCWCRFPSVYEAFLKDTVLTRPIGHFYMYYNLANWLIGYLCQFQLGHKAALKIFFSRWPYL